MGNERLRSQIVAAGHSYESVAGHLGVDPKTVERWVTVGRSPHTRHRWAAAELLACDEAYLWPKVLDSKRTLAASEAEFVHIYPTRGAVPLDFWRSLIRDARESLDFMAYAALFLSDNNPDLPDVIAERAATGVRVRILLGDPDSDAVLMRGEEEGIGRGLSERVRIVLTHLGQLAASPGVELRLHSTTLYSSVFRSDGVMLANTHVYGSPAAANPVLHLQRVAGGRMFDTYQQGFERVWESATPYAPPAKRRR